MHNLVSIGRFADLSGRLAQQGSGWTQGAGAVPETAGWDVTHRSHNISLAGSTPITTSASTQGGGDRGRLQ